MNNKHRLIFTNSFLQYLVESQFNNTEYSLILSIYRCSYGLQLEYTNGFFKKYLKDKYKNKDDTFFYRSINGLIKKNIIKKNGEHTYKLNGLYKDDRNFFTYIPMELIDVIIRTNLSTQEYKMILLVIIYTNGFRQDWTDKNFINEKNALFKDRSNCAKILKKLINKKILLKQVLINGHTHNATSFKINPNYNEWDNQNTI